MSTFMSQDHSIADVEATERLMLIGSQAGQSQAAACGWLGSKRSAEPYNNSGSGEDIVRGAAMAVGEV